MFLRLTKEKKDPILEMIKSGDLSMEDFSSDFKANRETVLAAVKSNGTVLKYASDELRADREVVLEAVKENGSALQYSSGELRADRGIALAAVKCKWHALQYVSADLRADHEFILATVKEGDVKNRGCVFNYSSDALRSYCEVMLASHGITMQSVGLFAATAMGVWVISQSGQDDIQDAASLNV
jgi:hypothetical protein